MNIAVIFAGGVGHRMGAEIPKQLLKVNGKPIIIYTLEQFSNHPEIDAIIVVFKEEYIDDLNSLLIQWNIGKVVEVTKGGATGQESIYLGLLAAREKFPGDSCVLIHDGVRPFITQDVISENIKVARSKGAAITVSPAIETICTVNPGAEEVSQVLNREICFIAKAPQTFILSEILQAHEQAISEGFKGKFTDSASLMKFFGHHLYVVEGDMLNIKITTQQDFELMKAILSK